MNLKLPPLYKRLLAFLVVIGPIFWLVFTEDGQRRTDSVVLFLWGEEEINLNLEALDNQFTESQLKEVFPDIEWKCQDQISSFGNRLCASRIGIFNSMPARYITIFFHDQWVNGLKVVYRRIYHDQLIQQLFQQMGNPVTENTQGAGTPQTDSILRWDTGSGNVILKHVLNEKEEPALLWLPHSVMPLGG
ncbi:MAG: hypothetical protein KZQ77_02020 [Candidatus Thiodiazotropha sp. (ex Notomyrtea botanica)]|nr:hypothetical protein [Candidatus Thiodiazotropha sp. (ex Notomyrtea botanica)]